MNTLATPAFAPAVLRILEVSYHCNISRTGGLVIPLGIMADLRASGVYGLGLVARQSLSEDEASQVGGLLRSHISSPFEYLTSIYDEVFHASAPPSVFESLPERHALSLTFTMVDGAKTISLPQPAKKNLDARRLWVKDELHSECNSAYWNMFDDGAPAVPVDKESKEDTAPLAA